MFKNVILFVIKRKKNAIVSTPSSNKPINSALEKCLVKNKRGENWVKFDAMEDNLTEVFNRFVKGRFEEIQQFHEFPKPDQTNMGN